MKVITCTSVFKLALTGLLFIGLFSCKKDKKSSPENFLNSYLQQSGFNQKSEDVGTVPTEFGLFFTTLKPGTIKKIHVQIPGIRNSLRVTLWNVATNQPLYSQVINVTTVNTTFSVDVTGVSLQPDVEYAISMNSIPFYRRKKTDGTNAVYPFTCGNIKILNYKWRDGTTQALPNVNALNYYGGDLSFDFLPND